jgi:hypothetical protein
MRLVIVVVDHAQGGHRCAIWITPAVAGAQD